MVSDNKVKYQMMEMSASSSSNASEIRCFLRWVQQNLKNKGKAYAGLASTRTVMICAIVSMAERESKEEVCSRNS